MTTLTTHTGGISDRALKRMITWGAVLLAVLLVAFAALYVLGQRSNAGPSLADRQLTAAEDAVKAAPQNIQDRLKLAASYQTVGRLDDAVAQFNEVLKAVPTNNTALLGLGTVKAAQGDLDGAKALFTKIASASKTAEFSNVDPTREAAFYWLGSIASQQKDFAGAINALNSALTIDNSDADAWYLLGTAQAAKGNDKVAVESLKRALMFVPTGWCEPYAALNSSYSRLNLTDLAEYAGAMTDFCDKNPGSATKRLEAITSGPAAVDALLGLGLIAESTSDRTQAASWYQKALQAQPGNTTALSSLDRLGVKPAGGSNAAKISKTGTTSGKAS